eukprot:1898362-Rhodomonas_salina.1
MKIGEFGSSTVNAPAVCVTCLSTLPLFQGVYSNGGDGPTALRSPKLACDFSWDLAVIAHGLIFWTAGDVVQLPFIVPRI